MAGIAALLDGRAALAQVRRFLPRPRPSLRLCGSPRELERLLQRRLIDAVMLGPRASRQVDLAGLRSRFPSIPLVIFGRLRAEDAGAVLQWELAGVAMVLVEGVDDPVAGDLVARQTYSRRRQAALAALPRQLRLTERLQLRAWEWVSREAGPAPRASTVAKSLGVSREHLSRQFGAGGAPTLKRVCDLLTVWTALDLLANPGYPPATVVRLLGFASPSHLRTTVRRVLGIGLAEARSLTPRELLRRFRSRSLRAD